MASWNRSSSWAGWRGGSWSGPSGGGPSLTEALAWGGQQWGGQQRGRITGMWWDDTTSGRGSPQSQVAGSAARRPSSEVAGSSAGGSAFSRCHKPASLSRNETPRRRTAQKEGGTSGVGQQDTRHNQRPGSAEQLAASAFGDAAIPDKIDVRLGAPHGPMIQLITCGAGARYAGLSDRHDLLLKYDRTTSYEGQRLRNGLKAYVSVYTKDTLHENASGTIRRDARHLS